MPLKLYCHPLSSFSQKALTALYENDTPFEPVVVDLFDEKTTAEFRKLWPIAKIPVLHDEAKDWSIPESSIIIEYLAQHYPGPTEFIPKDPELARQMRFRNRFFDLYLNTPMQKVVTDRLRPDGKHDAYGVEEARTLLGTSLNLLDQAMAAKTWAMGDQFTMADCAAAPSLFYTNMVVPLADKHTHAAAYLDRLLKRPSFARALKEAEPYFNLIPK